MKGQELAPLSVGQEAKNPGAHPDSSGFHSVQPETLSESTEPPALLSLPSSLKPLWRHLCGHVSLGTLRSVKVTVKLDQHKPEGARAVSRVCFKKEVPKTGELTLSKVPCGPA